VTPLHHLHAEPAKGTKGRAAVSLDIGLGLRVRLDGGDDEQKTETIRRMAQLWNMHEGIPTAVLESGAIRNFYDAVQALLDRTESQPIDFAALLAAAQEVAAKWSAITIEATPEGRRAECRCSEAA